MLKGGQGRDIGNVYSAAWGIMVTLLLGIVLVGISFLLDWMTT